MIGPHGENLIFLTSPPRAGSTLLQRLLLGSPDLFATAEPWIMLHPLFALRAHGHTADYNALWANAALTDFCAQLDGGTDAYLDAVRSFGRDLYNRALAPSGRRCFLDKTPRYYFIAPELRRTFPAAKFVFLLRNPLAVLASILDSWIKNDWPRLKDYACDVRLAPKLIADAIAAFGDDAIVLHYETLVAQPEAALRELCARLGIAHDDAMLDYGSRPKPPGRMGDDIGIPRHSRPVSESRDKWKSTLAEPRARYFAARYLDFLDERTLALLGYPKEQLVAELNAVAPTTSAPAPSWLAHAEVFFDAPPASTVPSEEPERRSPSRQGSPPGERTSAKNAAPAERRDSNSAGQTLSEGARRCLDQARSLLARGEREAARDYLERALDLAPAHPEIRALIESLNDPSGGKEPASAPTSTASEIHHPAARIQEPPPAPLVSIIISVYAAEKFLRACFEDLIAQTIFNRCEIIVIDSGSPEDERAIVEEYQRRCANIRYLRTERETLYAAWNRGVQMARGQYITNANADDSHRADALELLVAALDAHPEAGLAYGDYFTTHVPNDTFANPAPLRLNRHPRFHPATLMFYCVTGCHPMWRRTVFDQIGLFDPAYTAPGDYEFVLRFVSHGLRAVHVPEPITLFYQNAEGLSFKSRARTEREFNGIQAHYRAAMPIERLFAVNPEDRAAVARAWTALGNMALGHEVPWFDNLSQDLVYAAHCYNVALRHDPRCEAARCNLALATAIKERDITKAKPLLAPLESAVARRIETMLASGRLQPVPVDVPPAVEPLVYTREPCADDAGRSFALTPGASPAATSARFIGAFFDTTDLAASARAFAPELARRLDLGVLDRSRFTHETARAVSAADAAALRDAFARYPFLLGGVSIAHGPAFEFQVPPDNALRIGWTSAPFEHVSPQWLAACRQMDALWVSWPSQAEAHAAAGIPRSRISVLPEPVDAETFRPDGVEPWSLPRRAACNLLAFVGPSRRWGWDALLDAWLAEFNSRDDVCLWLQPEPGLRAKEAAELWSKLAAVIEALAPDAQDRARFEWLGDAVKFPDMPRLLHAVDAVVLPFRASAWGRRALEAMASGRAVIAPAWNGFSSLVTDAHALPLRHTLQPADADETNDSAANIRWAEPDVSHLRELLRRAQREPQTLRNLGARARAFVLAHHAAPIVAEMATHLIRDLEQGRATAIPDEPPCADAPAQLGEISIAWQGTFEDHGSLSHVNRELTTALQEHCGVKIARAHVTAPVPAANVTVRHAWPPDWERPAQGAFVVIQPWEYGALPAQWVRGLAAVDQYWVPSSFVRRVAIESGVPAGKVRVVPNGVNTGRFHPDVEPLALPTGKSFKFLFVGGTIPRKGADILLETYLREFTAQDDVCLVIKDFGGQGVYAGQTLATRIEAARRQPGAPEIIHLTQDLPEAEVAALLTACQCLVHPYRGEGFALPVIEAMACALPAIVTAGGATDDFANDDVAFRVPSRRVPIDGTIGGMALAARAWWLEPDADALASQMRAVVKDPAAAKAKGAAAARHVRANWSWEKAAERAAALARELAAQPVAMPSPVPQATPSVDAAKTAPISAAPAISSPRADRTLTTAREHLARREFEAAWRETLVALARRPFHPFAWMLLAEIALAVEDGAQARLCAERARALAPDWKVAKQFLSRPIKGTSKACATWPTPPAATEPRLSVCLIAKNEERFLKRCLDSIRTVATQIVVVDTGSTDRTVEIAHECGAEVFHSPWRDDFSAARNEALTHATGDWVLILDADEELAPKGAENLCREIRDARAMAFRLPLIDVGHEDEGCHYVPRLFRNAPGLFFTGRIHEQVFPSLEPLRHELGLDNRPGATALLHHGYSAELTKSRDKIERNLRLLRLALGESPNDANLRMNFGLELARAGELHPALDAYESAFQSLARQLAREVPPELRDTLLVQYCTLLLRARCFRRIIEVLTSPFAQAAGRNASLRFLHGMAATQLQRWPEAAEQFRACLTHRDEPALTRVHAEIRTVAPRHCLAVALARAGQPAEAEKVYLEAMKEAPKSFAVHFDFANFLFARGRDVDALRKLHDLAQSHPDELSVWQGGGTVALQRPEFLEVALDWTQAAHARHPLDETIAVQLAETFLLAGRPAEALPLWRNHHKPADARQVAALILCETAAGVDGPAAAVAAEALERELFQWLQRLVQFGAAGVLQELHRNLALLVPRCPRAAAQLTALFENAEQVAA